jgi:hypothetical protein
VSTQPQALTKGGAGAPGDAAPIVPLRERVRSLTAETIASVRAGLEFLWSQRALAWIVIPFACACWLPMGYSAHNWAASWNPLNFQPIVPFGAALLAWSRRDRLQAIKKRQQKMSEPRRGRTARAGTGSGNLLLAAGGCVLLVLAHLVHVDSLFAVGLLGIVAGVIYYLYGREILRALAVPLIFLLLLVNPPDSLVTFLGRMFGRVTVAVVAPLMSVFGLHAAAYGQFIRLPSQDIEAIGALDGSALFCLMAVLAVWYALFTRRSLLYGLVLVVTTALATIGFHLLQVALVAGTATGAPDVSHFVRDLNLWLVALVLSALLLYLTQTMHLLLLRYRLAEQRLAKRRPASKFNVAFERMIAPAFRQIDRGAAQFADRQRRMTKSIDTFMGKLSSSRKNRHRHRGGSRSDGDRSRRP